MIMWPTIGVNLWGSCKTGDYAVYRILAIEIEVSTSRQCFFPILSDTFSHLSAPLGLSV